MFYAIFTLALIAFPVALLFLPLAKFTDVGLQITGLDLFKYYAIDFVKMIISKDSSGVVFPDGLVHLWGLLTTDGCFLSGVVVPDSTGSVAVADYISLGQAGVIALMMLFSVIALIYFIVLLCKGYLRHARAIKSFMALDMVLSIFFGLSFVVYLASFALIGYAQTFSPWFAFIPFGAS